MKSNPNKGYFFDLIFKTSPNHQMKALNERIPEGATRLIYLALFLEIFDSDHEFCRNTFFKKRGQNFSFLSFQIGL